MATPVALRVTEGQARWYRRSWRGTVITSFVNPALYLLSLGIGLGTIVDRNLPGGIEGIGYVSFVASGLIAASAMQTGAGEASWPVMAGIKWTRTYEAKLATPIGITDLVSGHLIWVTIRLMMVITAFALVAALFGALPLGPALLAVPTSVLTGVAYAAPITAWVATLEKDTGLANMFRFAIVPMFLFSGVFFPVSELPDFLEALAYATPVFHGVQLARWITLGLTPAVSPFLSVAYLSLWVAAGWLAARLTFRRRLRG